LTLKFSQSVALSGRRLQSRRLRMRASRSMARRAGYGDAKSIQENVIAYLRRINDEVRPNSIHRGMAVIFSRQ
jgi:hypothetical protein